VQRRTIQSLEGRVPAAQQLAKRSSVEPLQQHGDGAVEFVQGEELTVAQGREDPALDHLHVDFGLGFVARFTGPSWQHRHYRSTVHLAVSMPSRRSCFQTFTAP